MLFTEPMVVCLALYASFTYSLIYLVLEVFQVAFKENRKWSLIVSTLPFLSIFVKAIYGKAVPQARLPPIIVGAILLSAGLFWFGWTAAPMYPWPLPVTAASKMMT